MTANQIAYVKYWEDVRSHKAQEEETRRHNLETEKLGKDTLGESVRHNIVTEGYTGASLAETQRHNVAQESYALSSLAESQRHNVAMEEETASHNRATEMVANLGYLENKRSNQQQEYLKALSIGEEKRSNRAREEETNRHNLVDEAIQKQRADTEQSLSLSRTVQTYQDVLNKLGLLGDIGSKIWNAAEGNWGSSMVLPVYFNEGMWQHYGAGYAEVISN